MAVAGLVVSILALIVAVASAYYARSQARSASGAPVIGRARHLEERRPRLSGRIERLGSGAHRLVVTLESDEPIGGLQVAISPAQGASFDPNVFGVWPPAKPGEPALTALAYDASSNAPASLAPGQSAYWKIVLAAAHASPIKLEADASGISGERWQSIPIVADVETDPLKAFY